MKEEKNVELSSYGAEGKDDVVFWNDGKYRIVDEGYAVINSDNLCNIYLIIKRDEYTNGYSISKNGEKIIFYRYLEDPNVTYLTSEIEERK